MVVAVEDVNIEVDVIQSFSSRKTGELKRSMVSSSVMPCAWDGGGANKYHSDRLVQRDSFFVFQWKMSLSSCETPSVNSLNSLFFRCARSSSLTDFDSV